MGVIVNIEYGYDILGAKYSHNFHAMRSDYFKVNIINGTSNQQPLPCLTCNP